MPVRSPSGKRRTATGGFGLWHGGSVLGCRTWVLGVALVVVVGASEPVLAQGAGTIQTGAALQWANPEGYERFGYGDHPLQFGDLRLPAGEGPHPVVVVVHGGCWRSDIPLDYIGRFSEALTAEGVATWTVEYRRVGDEGGGWPGTFSDVGAAVDHLRTLADSYQLDLERVVVAGHSAGGHLALWLAERHRVDDPSIAGPDPLRVAGAVSLAGVDDLRRALAEGVCGQVAAQLVGGTPDEHPERYALASPAERLPATVPQHLVNGSLDTIVPDTFGRAYAEKATAARSPVGLTLLPDAGHFEVVAPEADEWAIVRDVVLGMLP